MAEFVQLYGQTDRRPGAPGDDEEQERSRLDQVLDEVERENVGRPSVQLHDEPEATRPRLSIDAAIDAVQEDERFEREAELATQQYVAAGVEPEKAVSAYRLARKFQTSTEIVLEDYDFWYQMGNRTARDWRKVIEETPAAAEMMADPNFAPVIGRDGKDLGVTEKLYRDATSKFEAGVDMVKGGRIGWRRIFNRATDADEIELAAIRERSLYQEEYFDWRQGVGEFLAGTPGAVSEMLPFMGATVVGAADEAASGAALGAGIGGMGGAAAGGVGAVPGAIGGAITGGAIGLRVGQGIETGKIEAGLAYNEYRRMRDEKGVPISHEEAAGAALVVGAINGMIETAAFGKLLSTVPGFRILTKAGRRGMARALAQSPSVRAALGRLFWNVTQVGFVEGITESAQELTTVVGALAGGARYDASGQSVTANLTERLSDAFVQGLRGGAGLAAPGAAVATISDMRRAGRAQERAVALQALGKATQENRVFERLPEGLRTFVEKVKERHGVVEEVYVDPEKLGTFFQGEKVTPADVERLAPQLAENWRRAQQEGGEVAVPIEEMAEMAKSDNWADLVADIRLHPDEFTPREAQQYIQDLQDELDINLEEAPGDPLEQQIQQQLINEGRSPDVARKEAQLIRSFYETEAQRADMDVDELFRTYGVEIEPSTIEMTGQPLADLIRELQERGVPEPLEITPETELTDEDIARNVALRELPAVLEERKLDLKTMSPEEIAEELTGTILQQPFQARRTQVEQQAREAVEGYTVPEGEIEVPPVSRRKDGAYNGAPGGKPMVEGDVRKLVTRLTNLALSAEAVAEESAWWYEYAGQVIRNLTRNDAQLREQITRITALLSADNSLGGNIAGTIQFAYDLAKHGEATQGFGRYPVQNLKYMRGVLAADKMDSRLDGVSDKVMSFYRNLHDATEETNDFPGEVTLDVWMFRAFGYTAKNNRFIGPQYAFGRMVLHRITDRINKRTGMNYLPRQVQAMIWTAQRNQTMAERSKGATPKKPEHVGFEEYFDRAAAVVTWEANPSVYSGVFPEIMTQPPDVQRAFADEALQLITDDQGNNLALAQIGDIPLAADLPGMGAYDGATSPNVTSYIVLPQVEGGRDTEIANLYSNMLGIIYQQDAVPWHRPDPTLLQKDQPTMGVSLLVSEGSVDAKLLYDHMRDSVSAAEFSMVPRLDNRVEFRFMNFAGIPDAQYEQEIVGALNAFETNSKGIISRFLAEGAYLDNDWQKDPGGETYRQRLGEAGRSDLSDWAGDRRQAFLQLIEDWRQRLEDQGAETQLYQEGQDQGLSPRGFIDVAGDTLKITLTGTADLSTFIHESGHAFLEVKRRMVRDNVASQQQRDDWAILSDWLGLTPGRAIPRAAHEKFARGFEMYVAEGRAPSNALAQIFRAFKSWMLTVYKSLTELDVELTDEVRGVMDRMLATDDAIEQANISIGLDEMQSREQLSLLTDEEYAAYREQFIANQEEAEQALDRKVVNEAMRVAKKKWKDERSQLEDTLRADVMASQGGQMLADLETAAPSERILTRDLQPNQRRRIPKGTHSTLGMPVDALADRYDYDSGQALVEDLAATASRLRSLREEATEALELKYGKMSFDEIAEAALEEAHATRSQEVLLTELRGIVGKDILGPISGVRAAINQAAADRIGSMPVNKIQPAQYRRNELKAAKEAAAATDKFEAGLAKRRQLLNNALYREAVKAQTDAQKIQAYLRTFTTPKKRRQLGLVSTEQYSYLDAVDQLLEGVDLKRVSERTLRERQSFRDFVTAAEARDEIVAIPTRLEGAFQKNYRQMTPDELRGLRDVIKQINRLARLKNKIKFRGEQISLDALVDRFVATAQNVKPVTQEKAYEPTAKGAVIEFMRDWNAEQMKVEFVLSLLDGEDTGIMHEAIFQPIAEAQHARNDIRRDLMKRLNNLFRDITDEQREKYGLKNQSFMGDTMQGQSILAVALNRGNESNLDKMARGMEWDPDQLIQELDQWMDDRDWQLVQNIWDLIGELAPMLNETTRVATGLPAEMIDPTPFTTKSGKTFAGGYYPIAYDSTQKQGQETIESLIMAGSFSADLASPKAQASASHARTNYAAPLLFSLNVIPQHIFEVSHYVTHYEAVTQVAKIIRHPKFRNLIIERLGIQYYRQTLQPWLKAVADDAVPDRDRSGLFNALNYVRGGTSHAYMGWRLSSAAKQLLGIVPAAVFIGPKYLLLGVGKSLAGVRSTRVNRRIDLVEPPWQHAWEKSGEIRHTIENMDRDLRAVLNNNWGKVGLAGIPAQSRRVTKYAFNVMGYSQMAVNVAVWEGAYAKAIAEGRGEAEAVQYADSMVRMSQSAGAMKDLSNLQRGKWKQFFTQFMTYFTTLYNLLWLSAKRNGWRRAHRVALDYAVVLSGPVLVEMIIANTLEALFGEEEVPDEEELLWEFAKNTGMYAAGTVPIFRDVASAVATGRDVEVTSLVGPLNKLAQAARGMSDGDISDRDLTVFAEGLGMLLKIPVGVFKDAWKLRERFDQ